MKANLERSKRHVLPRRRQTSDDSNTSASASASSRNSRRTASDGSSIISQDYAPAPRLVRANAPAALEGLEEEHEQDPFGDGSSYGLGLTGSPQSEVPPPDSGKSGASVTKGKWGTIRQAVLSPGKEEEEQEELEKPRRGHGHGHQHRNTASSASSFSSSVAPPLPPLPPGAKQPYAKEKEKDKQPSRLAQRLGFRHVAEQAREHAVDDANKFASDLLRAVVLAHSPPDPQGTGTNGKGFGGGGQYAMAAGQGSSSLYLPFVGGVGGSAVIGMSTPVLPDVTGGSSFSGSGLMGRRKDKHHELKRPSSVSSFNTLASFAPSTQPSGPSVRPLYQVLAQHANAGVSALSAPYVPHEQIVLSALLGPFVLPVPPNVDRQRVEEERRYAYEGFEVLVRGWRAVSETSTLARLLFLASALLSPYTSPSALRPHILNSLHSLSSSSTPLFGSPIHFISLMSALFIVHASFRLQQSQSGAGAGTEQHMRVLDDVMSSLRAPSPPARLTEDEYKHALLLESLIRALASASSPRTAKIILRYYLDAYWPSSAPLPSQWPKEVKGRVVEGFLQACLGWPAELVVSTGVLRVLEGRVVREVEGMRRAGTGTEVERAEESVVKVVLRILRLSSPVPDDDEDQDRGQKGRDEDAVRWAKDVLCAWCRAAGGSQTWKGAVERTVVSLVQTATYPELLATLSALLDVRVIPHEDTRKMLAGLFLPALHERLPYPPYPSPTSLPQLSSLLQNSAKSNPAVFFKPLFMLAASTREVGAANLVAVVGALSVFYSSPATNTSPEQGGHGEEKAGFWEHDAGMLSVLLLGQAQGQGQGGGEMKLGQAVILIELVRRVQSLRRVREEMSEALRGSKDKDKGREREREREMVERMRFWVGVEGRLGGGVVEREKTNPLSAVQRTLLLVLWREIRLLVRSGKTPAYLPSTLKWLDAYHLDDEEALRADREVVECVRKVREVYDVAGVAVRTSSGPGSGGGAARRPARFSSFVPSLGSSSASVDEERVDLGTQFFEAKERKKVFESLGREGGGFRKRALKMLVTMSLGIGGEQWRRVGRVVWDGGYLDSLGEDGGGGGDGGAVAACFLMMQCAEKVPMDVVAIIEVDFRSSDPHTRLTAVRRLSTLLTHRATLSSLQPTVVTQGGSDRRIFKMARAQLPFVPSDMGSAEVMLEEPTQAVVNSKEKIPVELRRRLEEIGWSEDVFSADGDGDVGGQQGEWVRTPMTVLPSHLMNPLSGAVASGGQVKVESSTTTPVGDANGKGKTQSQSQDAGGATALLRRNSSTGGPMYGVKRRSIFVPSLAALLPRLASLAYDRNVLIASTVRSILSDLLRNDPALFIRPVLDLLAGAGATGESVARMEERDVKGAMSALVAMTHVRRLVPPGAAHDAFNNLAGFLKYEVKMLQDASRNGGGEGGEAGKALEDYAYIVPALARLVGHVGGMSVREFRRAKVDMFLMPSGALWFADGAPEVLGMFPRGPRMGLPSLSSSLSQGVQGTNVDHRDLVAVTMVRTAQNLLFLKMLRRNAQDVQHIRRNMTVLTLPGQDATLMQLQLQPADFVPRRRTEADELGKLENHRTIKAMSLMLSRSYILLVAQVFRSMSRHLSDKSELGILVDGLNRILLVHGDDIGIVGQVLVALMVASARFRRLFTSGGSYALFMPVILKVYTEAAPGSGIKLAIEYAANRFYALHNQSFIFQTLDVLAEAFSARDADTDGDWLASNVFSLFTAMQKGVDASTPDPAGIHNVNRGQEREALLVMTAEEKPQTILAAFKQGGTQVKSPAAISFPEEFEPRRLAFENLVRLFLTVIAHDHTILRAQQFLKFFRYLTPYLYDASSASRAVLQEGIDALGAVLVRASVARKENIGGADPENGNFPGNMARTKAASDVTLMRLDYLFLVAAFCKAGGQVSPPTIRQALSLVILVYRDSSHDLSGELSSFMSLLTKSTLQSDPPSPVKSILYFFNDIAPVVKASAATIDYSDLFAAVTELTSLPRLANDKSFGQAVITKICAAGVAACQVAASDNTLSTIKWRSKLFPLLARAVLIPGGDVIEQIERCPPTHDFLAYLVFPLTMALKTGPELSIGGRPTPWERTAVGGAWVRLLYYAMSACSSEDNSGRRDKSPDRRKSQSKHSSASAMLSALQVIKVIVIRGESDLSELLPGAWNRISHFLRSLLNKGSADFALQIDRSPFASPSHSPRNSGQFDLSNPYPSSPNQFPHSPSFKVRSVRNPSVVDYALWSLLEMLCVYRSPLILHMRVLIFEKLVPLNEELQAGPQLGGSPYRHAQPRVSSIFSKQRRRFSGMPSPDSSPRLYPSSSNQSTPRQSMDFGVMRQAGWAVPGSVQPNRTRNPFEIVHLGPAGHISSGGLLSPRLQGHGSHSRIKSLVLIQKTYQRIRTVQMCYGYELLLPLPGGTRDTSDGGGIGDDEVFTGTWTKAQALEAIEAETRDLMDEFDEQFALGDESLVHIDPDQTFSSSGP